MRAKEVRDLTSEELKTQLGESKQELFNLRFQLATGQLENAMRITDVKRTIARIKTVIREREINEEKAKRA